MWEDGIVLSNVYVVGVKVFFRFEDYVVRWGRVWREVDVVGVFFGVYLTHAYSNLNSSAFT